MKSKGYQHLIAHNNALFISKLPIHFPEWTRVFQSLQLDVIFLRLLIVHSAHLLLTQCFSVRNFHIIVSWLNVFSIFRNGHEIFSHTSLFSHWLINKGVHSFPHLVFERRMAQYQHLAFLQLQQWNHKLFAHLKVWLLSWLALQELRAI